ncbi:hypothetical protein ABBQ32_004151 [Trebouxia sp. C0010 RCD-2024]
MTQMQEDAITHMQANDWFAVACLAAVNSQVRRHKDQVAVDYSATATSRTTRPMLVRRMRSFAAPGERMESPKCDFAYTLWGKDRGKCCSQLQTDSVQKPDPQHCLQKAVGQVVQLQQPVTVLSC